MQTCLKLSFGDAALGLEMLWKRSAWPLPTFRLHTAGLDAFVWTPKGSDPAERDVALLIEVLQELGISFKKLDDVPLQARGALGFS